ncbi:MAG: ADOP family duplicated permease [Gemmatimonadales bacterium]
MTDPLRRRGLFEWILRRGRDPDAEVGDELDSHLALRIEALEAAGLGPAEARAEALRRFGDFAATRDALARDRRRRAQRRDLRDVVSGWVTGLRLVGRQAVLAPGFAAVWIGTLAAAVGLATAVFALVDGILLRPLAYPDSDRLVTLLTVDSAGGRYPVVSADNWNDWRRENRSLAAAAIYRSDRGALAGDGDPLRITVTTAPPELFQTVRPRLRTGRPYSESETAARSPVVVLAEGLWKQLGGERRSGPWRVTVDGEEREVIGVVAAGQAFPRGTDAWVPYRHRQIGGQARNNLNWLAVGRLADGLTPAVAEADLGRVAAQIRAADPAGLYSWGVGVEPLQDTMTAEARELLLLLQGAVLLVLLVACANLAAASLARGLARTREVAVRIALGAGRGAVLRQTIGEHLVLGLVGGAAGGALAWGLIRTVPGLLGDELPRLDNVRLDLRVLTFAVLTAGFSGLATGILPALQAAGAAPARILGGGRGTVRGGSRAGRWLVTGEIAVALLLVTGAGLLIESLRQVLRQPLGFTTNGVVTAELFLAGARYRDDPGQVTAYWDAALGAVRAAPGVAGAGLANWTPLGTGGSSFIEIEGQDAPNAGAEYRAVGEGYFGALAIPLLAGRDFASGDEPGAPRVAIVNRAFAERYWPGQDPLGRRLRTPGMEQAPAGADLPWLTVVGIVGDIRHWGYEAPMNPEVFVPWRQVPVFSRSLTLVARSNRSAGDLVPVVRERLLTIDPATPADVRPLAARADGLLASRRFTMTVLTAFAVLALALTAVGVYGVLSFSVAQRTPEFAVRAALGADPRRLVRWVVSDGFRLVALGCAAGALAAFLFGSAVRSLVFGVSVGDPTVLLTGVAVVGGAGLLAAWLPARRAARVAPMEVLRRD